PNTGANYIIYNWAVSMGTNPYVVAVQQAWLKTPLGVGLLLLVWCGGTITECLGMGEIPTLFGFIF
ncbi:hypothetical protein EBR96_06775, partial [bacterium]|nr:hypothetical protein [bacterium]